MMIFPGSLGKSKSKARVKYPFFIVAGGEVIDRRAMRATDGRRGQHLPAQVPASASSGDLSQA